MKKLICALVVIGALAGCTVVPVARVSVGVAPVAVIAPPPPPVYVPEPVFVAPPPVAVYRRPACVTVWYYGGRSYCR